MTLTVPQTTVGMSLAVMIAVLIASTAGCGEKRQLREWTPDDHGQEPAAETDTSRAAAADDDVTQGGDATARAAAALWRVTCATCHGQTGEGNGPARPPNANMTNFRDPAWQSARTDEQLAEVITKGRNLMPPFGAQINARGVAALVKHIRTLR